MSNSLGDRMKLYEGMETQRKSMPYLPLCARLDGKAFHSFCHSLQKPYDTRLSSLMVDTTKFLVESTGALVGYTQSDEISLLYYTENHRSQLWYDGKFQKICSVLSGYASSFFNKKLPEVLPEKADALPVFDCRVWNVPTREEAANVFLWREFDAVKNSISSLAQAHYSTKELHGKNSSEKQDMIIEIGDNWNNHPVVFKRGVYVQRRLESRVFAPEEINRLPELHAARTNPELEIQRSIVEMVEVPPLSKVVNRVGVLFEGHIPQVTTEER